MEQERKEASFSNSPEGQRMHQQGVQLNREMEAYAKNAPSNIKPQDMDAYMRTAPQFQQMQNLGRLQQQAMQGKPEKQAMGTYGNADGSPINASMDMPQARSMVMPKNQSSDMQSMLAAMNAAQSQQQSQQQAPQQAQQPTMSQQDMMNAIVGKSPNPNNYTMQDVMRMS